MTPPTTGAIRPDSRAIDRPRCMSNLALFRRIVFAAVLGGLVAGLLLTALQQLQIMPIILEAETFEHAASHGAESALANGHSHNTNSGAVHGHGNASSAPAHGHRHPGAAGGMQRTVLTALVNISLAVGFCFFLAAAFSLRQRVPGWGAACLWGLAGYAAFFVAPALGLPPELPGAEAAPLAGRQSWWALTVLATTAGLSLIAFAPSWAVKLGGAALILFPHWLGAPQPVAQGGLAPDELAARFFVATAWANAVFWLALGGCTAFFYRRAG